MNIGFWELVLVAIIGLLAVGPEKLPGVVRKTIIQVRKFKRMFNEVKHDFERELDLDDLKKYTIQKELEQTFDDVGQSFTSLEKKKDELIKDYVDQIDKELADIEVPKSVSIAQLHANDKAALNGISNDLAAAKAKYENIGHTMQDTGIEEPKIDNHKND